MHEEKPTFTLTAFRIQLFTVLGLRAATGQSSDIAYGVASTFAMEGTECLSFRNVKSKALAYGSDIVKKKGLPEAPTEHVVELEFNLERVHDFGVYLGSRPNLYGDHVVVSDNWDLGTGMYHVYDKPSLEVDNTWQSLKRTEQYQPMASLCIASTTLARMIVPVLWAQLHHDRIDHEAEWDHAGFQCTGTLSILVLGDKLIHGITTPIEHQVEDNPTYLHEGEAPAPADESKDEIHPAFVTEQQEVALPVAGQPKPAVQPLMATSSSSSSSSSSTSSSTSHANGATRAC